MELKKIKFPCSHCGARLRIHEETYYNDFGKGEVLKDSETEWECPNNCLFENSEIEAIDKEIERKLLEA